MNNDQLAYMQEQLAKGVTVKKLRENLVTSGYSPSELDTLLEKSDLPNTKPLLGHWGKNLGTLLQSYVLLFLLALLLPAVSAVEQQFIPLLPLYFVLVSVIFWLAYTRVFTADVSLWEAVGWLFNRPVPLFTFVILLYFSYYLFWVIEQSFRFILASPSLSMLNEFLLTVSVIVFFLPWLAVYSAAIAEYVKRGSSAWLALCHSLKLFNPKKYPLVLRYIFPSALVFSLGMFVFFVFLHIATLFLLSSLSIPTGGKKMFVEEFLNTIGSFFSIFLPTGGTVIFLSFAYIVTIAVFLPVLLFTLAYNGLRLYEKVK